MYDRFRGQERKIVVGIAFDAQMDRLLQAAKGLSEHTGMALRLTHVCELPKESSILATYPGELPSEELALLTSRKAIEEAKERLNSLVRSLDCKVPVETNVVFGTPTDGLRSDAVASRASLIITGARDFSRKFVPRGFSTALGLMMESPIPVMVIPEGARADLSQKKLSVMVADDLTTHSQDALGGAAELVYDLSGSELIHFHAFDSTEQEIRDWAERVLEAMSANQLTYDPEFSTATVNEKIVASLRDRLIGRLGFVRELLQKVGSEYKQIIKFGDVPEAIEQTVHELNPDILVFGRHSFVHREPSISVGHMPFYAMMGFKKPIIVIANVLRLRA